MKKTVLRFMSVALALSCLCVSNMLADAGDLPENKGNLRYSITVTKFKNEAGWHGRWDIGDGFGEIMTHELNASGWFIVIGEKDMRQAAVDEQKFADSGLTAGGKKAPKIGRMTPAQILVKGAITHVQSSTTGGEGGVSFHGIRLGGSKDAAEINITIYLVSSETGQVMASTKVIGKSDRKGLGLGYFGDKLGGLRGDLKGFRKDNVGKACEDAVAQAVEFLIEQIQSVPWEGTVMLAKGDKIIINRGTREGVSVGAKFDVGTVEQLVDEDTGEVLDEELTKIAAIEVTKVKEKIAYCKALHGGNMVKKGLTVYPAK